MSEAKMMEMLTLIRDEIRELRRDLGLEIQQSPEVQKAQAFESDAENDGALASIMDTFVPLGDKSSSEHVMNYESNSSKLDFSNDELEKILGDK